MDFIGVVVVVGAEKDPDQSPLRMLLCWVIFRYVISWNGGRSTFVHMQAKVKSPKSMGGAAGPNPCMRHPPTPPPPPPPGFER